MRKSLYIVVLLILPNIIFAQQLSVDLDQCRNSAKENWPSFKKVALQQENRELITKALNKNYLPKLTFSGSATYQSEVVVFPEIQLPGAEDLFPSFPKDNYRADLQLSQIIYDGGNTESAKKMQLASNSLEETEIPGVSTREISTLPQLKTFEAQENMNEASLEMEFRNKFPKLALFANAGFGNPGYNFMNTDLHSYGMVGVNLSWNVIDWGTYGKHKEKSEIKRKLIEANKESFVKHNNLEVEKINNEMTNLISQIEMDFQIIEIKEEIKNSSWSKFQNGTITSNEYLKDFNDLKRAQQTLEINKIQVIQKKLALKHLEGFKY